MPLHRVCQICSCTESRYTCSRCPAFYCSVPCYKQHKESSCSAYVTTSFPTRKFDTARVQLAEDEFRESKPLRPLTSLNWPYVPEESTYPDPLKRDDPKSLHPKHYEAIATSPDVRNVLQAHDNLPTLLSSIDKLRGPDREQALQRALGVTEPDIIEQTKSYPGANVGEPAENVRAMRALAEAVERAVRGDRKDVLGLDWGTE